MEDIHRIAMETLQWWSDARSDRWRWPDDWRDLDHETAARLVAGRVPTFGDVPAAFDASNQSNAPGAPDPSDQYRASDAPCCTVLLHCDLAPGHVLYDPSTGALTGIIDFGDVAIGEPTNPVRPRRFAGEYADTISPAADQLTDPQPAS